MSKESRFTRKEFVDIVKGSVGALVLGGFLRMTLGEEPQSPAPSTPEQDIPRSEPEPEIGRESPLLTETSIVKTPNNPETGIGLVEDLGWRGKVVYIVYGRPQKYGVPCWGSLGLTQTAEESWAFFQARKEAIIRRIGKNEEEFALNVINPVYYNDGDPIKDIYVAKALEMAPEEQGLVALGFNDINLAQATLIRLETFLPKERLAYLAVSLDAEHFPNHQVDARAINNFSTWFAQKHQQWAERKSIPGLIFIYTFGGGKILNQGELIQYYPDKKTLVAPVFDGYGTLGGKESGMAEIMRDLPNRDNFPALLGTMEFRLKWGDKYDKCTVKETFSTLEGQPVFFFASQ